MLIVLKPHLGNFAGCGFVLFVPEPPNTDDKEDGGKSKQYTRLRQDGGQPLTTQNDIEHALHRPCRRQDFDGGADELGE